MSQLVFIAFQDNDNARYLVDAVVEDNPHAEVQYPARHDPYSGGKTTGD